MYLMPTSSSFSSTVGTYFLQISSISWILAYAREILEKKVLLSLLFLDGVFLLGILFCYHAFRSATLLLTLVIIAIVILD